jgi:hypothetical protein
MNFTMCNDNKFQIFIYNRRNFFYYRGTSDSIGTGQLQIYEFKARSIEEIASKLESHASGASCIRYVSTTKWGAGGWARVRVPICGLQQHPRLTETRLQARATPRHLYTHTIYYT